MGGGGGSVRVLSLRSSVIHENIVSGWVEGMRARTQLQEENRLFIDK